MKLSTKQFERVERLYFQAQQIAPIEWSRYLDQECGDDEPVRAEVNELLQHHADARSVKPLVAGFEPRFSPLIGTRIGSYHVIELIGEGGMGLVFRAEQEQPVKRTVALKLIRAGMDSDDVVARFESERQALALMNHPNVARVFDAGTTHDGRHYFVMEYVNGQPVNEYCDSNRLSTGQRLELFLQICDAVHHAHQRGIIHRDLKPSNMLVATIDGKPVTKVIDFGIAKAVEQPLTQRAATTMLGELVGTPEYMSPEQAEMGSLEIDTRSDIYSAGVVLYELLCGAPPFDRAAWKGMPFDRVVQMIREVDPPKPSTRFGNLDADTISPVAQKRSSEPSRLARVLRGELDWITMKALEKNPAQRYPSAAQLGEDVRRYLDYQPVLAGPPSAVYRARKFVRRHRIPVIAGALVFLAIVAGSITTIYQARQAIAQKALAEKRFNDVRRLARTMIFDVDNAMEKNGVVQARQVLVHTALVYLDGLAAERNVLVDREFAREIVKGYDRIGRVQYFPGAPSLDNPKGALSSYRKALDLAQRLISRYPDDQLVQDDLPYRYMMVADGAQIVEGPTVAREHYLLATKHAQVLVDRDPTNVSALRAIGIASGRIGLTYKDQHNGREAMHWYRRQLKANEQIAQVDPDTDDVRRSLAHANTSIGRLLLEMGDPVQALAHFTTARQIHVAVSGEAPEQNINRRAVNNSLSYVMQAQMDCLMLDEALASGQQLLIKCESAAAKDKSDLLAAQDLASAHYQLARLYERLGQPQKAIDSVSRALEIQRPLADRKGSSLPSRDTLSHMDEFLSVQFAKVGRTDDALAAAARARAILEDSMGFKRQHLGHLPQLADLDHALGVAKLAAGRIDDAVADLKLEVEARQRLDDANAALALDRYEHVLALLALTEAQLVAGKTTDAETTGRLAFDRAEALVADAPHAPLHFAVLASAQLALARTAERNAKPEEVDRLRQAALATIRPIAQAHPKFADAGSLLEEARLAH